MLSSDIHFIINAHEYSSLFLLLLSMYQSSFIFLLVNGREQVTTNQLTVALADVRLQEATDRQMTTVVALQSLMVTIRNITRR